LCRRRSVFWLKEQFSVEEKAILGSGQAFLATKIGVSTRTSTNRFGEAGNFSINS
jgi:hypothetical protein